jgi:hypothetical protein
MDTNFCSNGFEVVPFPVPDKKVTGAKQPNNSVLASFAGCIRIKLLPGTFSRIK